MTFLNAFSYLRNFNRAVSLFNRGAPTGQPQLAERLSTAVSNALSSIEDSSDSDPRVEQKMREVSALSRGGAESNIIKKHTEDMLDLARKGLLRDYPVGREELKDQVETDASRCSGLMLLYGKPGTGKTSAVERLCYDIVRDRIALLSPNKTRVYRLSTTSSVYGSNGAGGVVQNFKTAVFGEPDPVIETVVRELRRNKTKDENIILFVDEIHRLINWGFLLRLLAELDEPGLMIIGASSNEQIYNTLRNLDVENGRPLARRLRPIYVPEVSAKEACEILAQKKESFSPRFPQVKLTEDGIQAVVYLGCVLEREGTHGLDHNFPGRAFHASEQVIAFHLNRRGPEKLEEPLIIDSKMMIAYLMAISSMKSEDFWESQLKGYSDDGTIRRNVFKENFRPLKKERKNIPSGRERKLQKHLQGHFNNKRAVLVVSNSQSYLEGALTRLWGFNSRKREAPIYSLRVDLVVPKIKDNPRLISVFNELLNEMAEGSILLLQNSDLLLQYMKLNIKGSRNPLQDSRSPLIPDLGNLGEQFVARSAAFLQNQVGVVAESLSTQKDETFCAALEALKAVVLRKKLHCVLQTSESVQLDERALEDVGVSAEWTILTPSDWVQELQSELVADHKNFLGKARREEEAALIKKLIFLSYFLPNPRKYVFPADFSFAVFEKLQRKKKDDRSLVCAFTELSEYEFRREDVEECLRALDGLILNQKAPFKRLARGVKRATNSDAPLRSVAHHQSGEPSSLKEGDLQESNQRKSVTALFPSLFASINEFYERGSAWLRIEDPDLEKADCLASISAEYISQSGQIPIIRLSQLLEKFPAEKEQKLFLEIFLSDVKKAIVLIEKNSGASTERPFFQELIQKKGIILIQGSASVPVQEEALGGVAEGLIQQGANLLNRAIRQQNHSSSMRPSWLGDKNCVTITHPALTKEQFQFFISQAIPSAIPEEVKQTLISGYYFFNQPPHSVSIGRIRSWIAADIKQNLQNKENAADRLFQNCAQPLGVNKSDLLHAIAPESSSFIYRLTQKVKRAFSVAIVWITFPVKIVTGWFVSRTIVRGISWIGRGLISNLLFRGFS